MSVSIPNHVRNRQLPLSPSSQQPPSSHSSHPNDRLHQARKASSTALGPSSLRFHHRLRLKVRGARNTAANMPGVQEVSYQPRPCPLTSFLSRPSIPMSQTRPRDRLPEPLRRAWLSLPYPFDTNLKTPIPDVRRRSFSGTTLPVTQHLQHSKRLFQKTCSRKVHHQSTTTRYIITVRRPRKAPESPVDRFT